MARRRSHAPEDLYDAFIAYNSSDLPAVQGWTERLIARKLKLFFDKNDGIPGTDSQMTIEQALSLSRCCVAFVGDGGVGPWQREEVRIAVRRMVETDGFRVFAAFLPGAGVAAERAIPKFLANVIHYRLDGPNALDGLIAAIEGRPPGAPNRHPHWLTEVRLPALDRPTGIAHHGHGVYVVDHLPGEVLLVRGGAEIRRVNGLNQPHHIAVNNRLVVVCDTYNDQLVFYNHALERRFVCEKLGNTKLKLPHDVQWVSETDLLVANSEQRQVTRAQVDAAKRRVSVPRDRPRTVPIRWTPDCVNFEQPNAVTSRADHRIVVADTFGARIHVFEEDFTPLATFGQRALSGEGFAHPAGLACWGDWLVVADEHNQRLQLWSLNSAAGTIQPACIAPEVCPWIKAPFGLAFTSQGEELWVTDRKGGTVYQIDFAEMVKDAPNTMAALGHN